MADVVTRNSSEDHGSAKNQASSGIMCTKVLNIQNKRYYFDVKEHEYGRFLKLAETAQSGRKSRLVIPMYLVPEFERIMTEMHKHLSSLEEFRRPSEESDDSQKKHRGGGDGKRNRGRKNERVETEAAIDLKADIIERGRRKYYFNLKENTRGRYLRVKAIGDIPSTLGNRRRGNRGRGRNASGDQAVRAVIIPSSGVDDFRAELTEILSTYRVDENNDKVATSDKNIEENGAANEKLPASQRFSSKSFRKVLFVDAGENSRGVFARITEVQGYNRDAVTVPSRHFKQLGEWFLEAARVAPDEAPSDDERPAENGGGDASAIKGDQQVPNGNYDDDRDDESSEIDVAGSRRRDRASDDEE